MSPECDRGEEIWAKDGTQIYTKDPPYVHFLDLNYKYDRVVLLRVS